MLCCVTSLRFVGDGKVEDGDDGEGNPSDYGDDTEPSGDLATAWCWGEMDRPRMFACGCLKNQAERLGRHSPINGRRTERDSTHIAGSVQRHGQ